MRTFRRCVVPLAIVVAALGNANAAFARPHLGMRRVRRHISRHATKTVQGAVEVEGDIERDAFPDGSRGTQLTTTGRFRLADGIQLNLQVPALSTDGAGSLRLGDVSAGVNVQVFDDVPMFGDVFVLPMLKAPTGSLEQATGTGTTDGTVLLVSSNQFGAVGVDLSAGYTRRSGDGTNAPRRATLWSAAVDGPIRRPLGWAIELSGLPATTGPAGSGASAALTAGPTWNVHDRLAVDVAVMMPIAGDQPKALFVSAVYRSPNTKRAPGSTR
ncbi:MAG: hypothetical protein JSU08_11015 [Acidobacteria bacterium]|nr:hypothetical protein [Acidobacteriota bacterium]